MNKDGNGLVITYPDILRDIPADGNVFNNKCHEEKKKQTGIGHRNSLVDYDLNVLMLFMWSRNYRGVSVTIQMEKQLNYLLVSTISSLNVFDRMSS